MKTDPIVDEVRRVRAELIEQYGGIDGYFKHLQSVDRARNVKRRNAKTKAAANSDSGKQQPRKPRVRAAGPTAQ